MEQDKVNRNIFGLPNESPEDSNSLPDPDVITLESAENLEDALEQFSGIVGSPKGNQKNTDS
jgi:type I restriction enzyme M protein